MSGRCAKTTVICTLILADGSRVIGTNDCASPQATCPRSPGEDYGKCRSICHQPGHAETVALAVALRSGLDVSGAHAYVEGNTYACRPCQETLFGAGVAALTLGSAPPHWQRSLSEQVRDLHESNNELLERARRAEARNRELEAVE